MSSRSKKTATKTEFIGALDEVMACKCEDCSKHYKDIIKNIQFGYDFKVFFYLGSDRRYHASLESTEAKRRVTNG